MAIEGFVLSNLWRNPVPHFFTPTTTVSGYLPEEFAVCDNFSIRNQSIELSSNIPLGSATN